MTDSNSSSPISSSASSPAVSPKAAPAPSAPEIVKCTLAVEPKPLPMALCFALGKTDLRWKNTLATFFKNLKVKKTRPKKESSPKTKPKIVLNTCAACSWNDPKKSFEPVEQALLGNIPLDRKPCGKKGSIEVKDFNGHSIWICATHAKPTADTCSRCQKAGIECKGHGQAFLQTGYISANGDYYDGTCEALKREGLAKLAKLGHSSRTVQID